MTCTPVPPAHRTKRLAEMATLALAAATTLASCSGSPDPTPIPVASSPRPGSAALPPSAQQGGQVTLQSGWAKAGSGMTAVFGTVVNPGTKDVTLLGGSSPAAADVQIHSMVKQPDGSMKMTQKQGGLTVPAGGSAELTPGADHIMLVNLHSALVNGGDVSLVLRTADGANVEWTVPVRSFAGAEETYAPEDHR